MEWAARLPLAAGAGDLHRAADQRGKRRARAQLVEELGREHRLFRPALADVVPAFRAGADADDGRNANAADQRDERDGEQAQARGSCFSDNLHPFFPSRRPLLSASSEEHTPELPSLMRTAYAVFCVSKTTSSHTMQSTTIP